MTYYDLDVPLEGVEPLDVRVAHERKMGFKVFAFSTETSDIGGLEEKVELLEGVKARFSVENSYSKLNLKCSNVKLLKAALKSFRGRFDIFSVAPEELEVFRSAGRDRRVDTIIVDEKNFRWLDNSQARLMRSSRVFLELVFSKLLALELPLALRILRRALEFYRVKDVPLIVSLGARTRFEARHPKQISSLLRFLGLNVFESKNVLTLHPRILIERSKHRRSGVHVLEGVDIVES